MVVGMTGTSSTSGCPASSSTSGRIGKEVQPHEQDAGDEALGLELGPEPGGDELVEALAIESEPAPLVPGDGVEVDRVPDRDADVGRGRPRQPQADLRDGPDRHAPELDRRAHHEPVHGPAEVRHQRDLAGGRSAPIRTPATAATASAAAPSTKAPTSIGLPSAAAAHGVRCPPRRG